MRDIFATLSQWRYAHGVNTEPVEQVFPEASLQDFLFQVAVGGGDDAHIHPASAKKKKLSYKDQRELENLPALIEELESRQGELETQISAPDFYQQEHTVTDAVLEDLAALQEELEQAYARWEELEG